MRHFRLRQRARLGQLALQAGKGPLLHIATAVAKGRDLECRQITFDPAQGNLLARLEAARERNNLIVVLVDGKSLCDAALVAELKAFDKSGYDATSTLVVWPLGKGQTAAETQVRQAFPSLSLKQPPVFSWRIDAPDQFAREVGHSLDTLTLAVLKNPRAVSGPPGGTEYPSVPTVSAAGGSRAA